MFVDRQQLDAAINYQIAEVFGGVVQSERTIKGLMLNVAIRFMMKWQMDSHSSRSLLISATTTRWWSCIKIWWPSVKKSASHALPARHIAPVSTGPLKITHRPLKPSWVNWPSPEAASDTILKTFNPMKPVIPEVDFNEFGV